MINFIIINVSLKFLKNVDATFNDANYDEKRSICDVIQEFIKSKHFDFNTIFYHIYSKFKCVGRPNEVNLFENIILTQKNFFFSI